MNRRVIMTIIMLQALVCTFALQPAWAEMLGGCGQGDVDYNFELDKKAPGTKVDVSLTLFYDQKGTHDDCQIEMTDMHYFMRAKIGNDNLTKFASSEEFVTNYNYLFAGVLHDVCYKDWAAQKEEIKLFFFTTVVPELFDGIDLTTASVKVKSVSNLAEDENSRFPGCCEEVFPDGTGKEVYFMMMDLVLAVQ